MIAVLRGKWHVLACVLICTLAASNIRWPHRHINDLLQADARGYYAYLPGMVFFNTLSVDSVFGHEAQHLSELQHVYDYRHVAPKGTVNKYFAGTAVCEAPFFLVAYGIATATADHSMGYGRPYMLAISVAGLSFLLLGLWCCDALLVRLGIGLWPRVVAIVSMCFGTNLFYYAAIEPGMSHVFSFGLVSLFLLLGLRWIPDGKRSLTLGLILGLIILIRPINILVLAGLPFIFILGDVRLRFPDRSYLLRFALAATVVVMVQSIIYILQTGSPWVYSYGDQTLDLLRPHLIHFLFSFKKGFLLYTPWAVLAIAGFYAVFRANGRAGWAGLVFIIGLMYVLSSWEVWWYGGSFSARPMVEYLPFLVVPFAHLMLHIWPGRWRWPALVLIFVLIGLCQFQTYQYRYYRIHWEDTDRALYLHSFTSVGPE
jgi:hypothetical protein